MTDVYSYALYTQRDRHPLRDATSALLADGWVVATPSEWEQPPDIESSESKASDERLLNDLTERENPSIPLEKNGLRVRLGQQQSVGNDQVSVPAALQIFSEGIHFRYDGTPEQRDANVSEYVDLVERIVTATDPAYVFGTAGNPEEEAQLPSVQQLRSGRIPWVYWLNVFSNQTIEALGRDRILYSPAWLVREIGEDHVLVVTRNSPIFFDEEWRYGPERVMTHLSQGPTEAVSRRDETTSPTEWYEAEQAKWLFPPDDPDET